MYKSRLTLLVNLSSSISSSSNEEDYNENYDGVESNGPQEEKCSIDYFTNNLTPDDYEESNKIEISKEVSHINNTRYGSIDWQIC